MTDKVYTQIMFLSSHFCFIEIIFLFFPKVCAFSWRGGRGGMTRGLNYKAISNQIFFYQYLLIILRISFFFFNLNFWSSIPPPLIPDLS